MIDFVELKLRGNFPPIGKALSVTQPSGVTTTGFTKDRAYLFGHGADFQVQLRRPKGGDVLELAFSPPKILQGHNGLGSNDLIGVVQFSVERILAGLNIPLDTEISSRLTGGDYQLTEVHIAELHAMPHARISDLCDSIRRTAKSELQVQALKKGIGLRLWADSDSRTVLIYDKLAFFNDKPFKHLDVLYAGIEPAGMVWLGLHLDFADLRDYLRQGVRIETRLKAPYLRRRHLDLGSAWSARTAREHHFEVLQSVPIRDCVLTSTIDRALAESPPSVQTLLLAWQLGRNPRDFCSSPTTYYRHRKSVLARYGFDLSAPWIPPSAGTRWADLIAESSVVARSPEWARRAGFFFSPRRPLFAPRVGLASVGKKVAAA